MRNNCTTIISKSEEYKKSRRCYFFSIIEKLHEEVPEDITIANTINIESMNDAHKSGSFIFTIKN